MNRRVGHETVRGTGQPTTRRRRRAAAAVIGAAVIGAAALSGCGHETLGAQPGPPAAAARNLAVSANSGCVQAMPVVERALGALQQLRRGVVTAADAQRQLAASQTTIGGLARTTSDDILRENLAEAFDAFAAYRSVMLNRNAPAYQDTFSSLAGELAGFRRTCSVGNPGFETDIHGWSPVNADSALSRSTTAYHGRWSLQVTNAGTTPAAAGFTDSTSWVSTTLKGSEQIGLWARAVTGAPMVTVRVQELSGGTVLGSRQVTARLDPTFRFEDLTYHVRRPGGSRLSVMISAADLPPGEAFLVDDITIMRD